MKIRCCLSRAWAGSMAGPDLAGGEECWPGLWDGDAGRADEGGRRALGRRIRQTSHPRWDGDKRGGAKSHPKWDLCRMVLSSSRMSGAESPEKWDSCRTIGATSHPAWDVCRMILSFDGTAGAKSHFKWDVCKTVLPSSVMSGATSPEKWDSCRVSGAKSPRGWDAAIFIPESRPRVRRCGRSRAPEAWAGGHDNPVMKSFP